MRRSIWKVLINAINFLIDFISPTLQEERGDGFVTPPPHTRSTVVRLLQRSNWAYRCVIGLRGNMLSFNGMAMRCRLTQRSNAKRSILSTSGNSKFTNCSQPLNADASIVLTDGIVIFVEHGSQCMHLLQLFPTCYQIPHQSMMCKIRMPYSTSLTPGNFIPLREQHPWNAYPSTFSISSCVSTATNFLRPLNALYGIILTDRSMRNE